MSSISVRLILECPYKASVVKFKPDATVADFLKSCLTAISEACVVGTRIDEPEFTDAIIKELREDGQEVPPRGISTLRWPDLAPLKLTPAVLSGSMSVRRIPYGTAATDFLGSLQFLPAISSGTASKLGGAGSAAAASTLASGASPAAPVKEATSLAEWGVQDRDSLVLTLLGAVRDGIVTHAAVPEGPSATSRAIKTACPYASWEGISILLAMYNDSQKRCIDHLKEEYNARKEAARKAKAAAEEKAKAPKDGGTAAAGGGAGGHATVTKISAVRAKVSWATPAKAGELLETHKGDVAAVVAYLNAHRSELVQHDPKVLELRTMFPSHKLDTIAEALKAGGGMDEAALLLLDIAPDDESG